jgi:hypothetical protein
MTPPPPRGLNALASAASSAATGTSSSGRNMADDDASLDELLGINDHHGAPEVQEMAPTKDPTEDACLDDVEFIDEDASEPQLPVQKAKRGQQPHLTKIKSILGKAVKDISRAVLQKFCIHNDVLTLDGKSCQTVSKPHMCDRIVKYIEDPVGAKQFETPWTALTDPTVNKVRLINVLFGVAAEGAILGLFFHMALPIDAMVLHFWCSAFSAKEALILVIVQWWGWKLIFTGR